jgi:hypothetical protein
MRCLDCGKESSGPRYCGECGSEVKPKVSLYRDPYGVWEVTTEGDDDGRTIKNLGIHCGYVDEIALMLSSACFYSLKFSRVTYTKSNVGSSVSVVLDIESGTWDLSKEDRVDWFKKFFAERDVDVEPGDYFASVVVRRRS